VRATVSDLARAFMRLFALAKAGYLIEGYADKVHRAGVHAAAPLLRAADAPAPLLHSAGGAGLSALELMNLAEAVEAFCAGWELIGEGCFGEDLHRAAELTTMARVLALEARPFAVAMRKAAEHEAEREAAGVPPRRGPQ
jgi:hypothetical protein